MYNKFIEQRERKSGFWIYVFLFMNWVMAAPLNSSENYYFQEVKKNMKGLKVVTTLALSAAVALSGLSAFASDEETADAVEITKMVVQEAENPELVPEEPENDTENQEEKTENQEKDTEKPEAENPELAIEESEKDTENQEEKTENQEKDTEKPDKDSDKLDDGLAKEAEKADKISVKINGKEVDFTEYDNVLPFIENDRTLIPIRAIAEGLGLEVYWNDETKTVTIKGRVEISLPIDSDVATVNGESVQIEVPACIVESRTFVPVRFISENMDTDVDWEEETQTVIINEKNGEKPEGEDNMRGEGNRGGMGGGITAGAKGDRNPNVETDPEIVAVINEGAEKFVQDNFDDEETGISLEYSLYIPEDYDENETYPMIMYIPDASGASKSAKEIVEQYYGANVWVTDEEQEKHAAFVLVPAFSVVVVDDDWNTSEEIEAAVNLINFLTESYSIDTDRLYTTGQSMGCMTSIYLNSKYPDLFAASLFVSGQWDISVLQPLENKKFFYITAGGDEKASGGQDEVKAMFDADGVGYSYGTWSAQNSQEEQSAAAQELIDQGYDANMIRFEKGTVLEGGGMEHNASFNYGYKIPAVRDWLFEQSK